jgi:hypothetical protein
MHLPFQTPLLLLTLQFPHIYMRVEHAYHALLPPMMERDTLLISPSSWNHAYTVIGPSSMQLSDESTCNYYILVNMH